MKRNPSHYRRFLKTFCEVCGTIGTHSNPLDADHVKTFGSGGSDEHWNIMTLCRIHHIEKGKIGIGGMAIKYDNYKKWLIKNDWEIEELRGKWVRYEDK